jgi:hypothetical protein
MAMANQSLTASQLAEGVATTGANIDHGRAERSDMRGRVSVALIAHTQVAVLVPAPTEQSPAGQ